MMLCRIIIFVVYSENYRQIHLVFCRSRNNDFFSARRDVDLHRHVDSTSWLGVYLDSSWLTDRVAGLKSKPMLYLGWPDMGVFALDLTYRVCSRMLWFINDGTSVEIGCVGGHGRTGTLAACFLVYRGMKSKDAINHVRNTYCRRAIETQAQEIMVQRFEVLVQAQAKLKAK